MGFCSGIISWKRALLFNEEGFLLIATAKKKHLKVQNNLNQQNFFGSEDTRPKPPTENVPEFFLGVTLSRVLETLFI